MADSRPVPLSMMPSLRLNDGRAVPQLGLGVWQVPDDTVASMVRAAIDVGYRSIDTATIYGNERGVGQGIRESGLPREQLFITTKLWNNSHGYDATLAAFNLSLAKLRLDYVDLYLIHWPVASAGRFVDSWRAMIKLQQEGRVRSIGVCNFNPAHLVRLIDETGVRPVVNQIELHPGFQQREVSGFNGTLDIVTEAWSPLGQGRVLTHPVITAIAHKWQRTPAQVVLRWHLDQGFMVIPKTVHADRLRENLGAFGFSLDDQDRDAIRGLDDPRGRLGEDPDEVRLGLGASITQRLRAMVRRGS
jgi:2,5-diketo-D-gluconate reductase A